MLKSRLELFIRSSVIENDMVPADEKSKEIAVLIMAGVEIVRYSTCFARAAK